MNYNPKVCSVSGDSVVRNPPANAGDLETHQETWVWFLGWEDPLEKEMATHSSILSWKISWRETSGRLQSMGSQRVRHDWVHAHIHTHTHTHTHTHSQISAGSSLVVGKINIFILFFFWDFFHQQSGWPLVFRDINEGIPLYTPWRKGENVSKHEKLTICKGKETNITAIMPSWE